MTKESQYYVPNVTDKYDLTPEAYLEIYRMVNRRRPWDPSDSVKHHFFENIAENPAEAAMYKACGEYFIKGY
jgi:hypothetical protein